MTQIDQLISDALSQPTACERVDAFLAIDPRGLPGATQLRARQARLRARQALWVRQDDVRQDDVRRAYAEACCIYKSWGYRDYDGRASVRADVPLTRAVWSTWRRLRREEQILVEQRAVRDAHRAQIIDRYTAVILARGGEINVTGSSRNALHVIDDRDGAVLLSGDGWGRRRGGWSRIVSLRYLCGHDDSGDWAVRVAGTCDTVYHALQWITPAGVRKAQAAGRAVLRQGDLYAIQTTRAHDLGGDPIPSSHRLLDGGLEGAGRWLLHGEHAPLQIPWPCRFARQRVYAMGGGARRRHGD